MGSHASKSRALIAFALFISVEVRLAHAAPGDIHNLGTVAGQPNSEGFGINASGQVAGTGSPAEFSSFTDRAFRYDGTPGSGGVMHDLGTLPGTTTSYGRAINDAGQVTGASGTTGIANHAFRYDGTPGNGGVMRDLGTLGGSHSSGYAINASGQVAGWSQAPSFNAHVFRYTGTPGSGGAMADLGTLGGNEGFGFGINDAGQVTGYSNTPSGATRAFRYTGTPGSGGAMVDLGTLGGAHSWGFAINDSGQVAGDSGVSVEPGNFDSHAFRYDGTPGSGGVMRDLGTLGGTNSYGRAINASGQVAGYSDTDATQHAFLYTGTPGAGGQMIDLDAWLDANNPAEGAKWELITAYGLSDSGLVTGLGLYGDEFDSGRRAFRLDASALVVPEPSNLALLGLAVPVLLRLRARPKREISVAASAAERRNNPAQRAATARSGRQQMTKKAAACACIGASMFAFAMSGPPAAAQTVVIPFTDRGWYNDTGFHHPDNPSYIVGDLRGTETHNDIRDFFVFDLSGVAQPIESAKLALFVPGGTGYGSPNASENYELHDVTTPIGTLVAGTGGVAAHADLGGGVVYGSRTMTLADRGFVVEIPLDAAAIAALDSATGLIGIGGSLTTLDAVPNNEYTFGSTGHPTDTSELRLTVVPEPGAGAGAALGIAAIRLLCARRRREPSVYRAAPADPTPAPAVH